MIERPVCFGSFHNCLNCKYIKGKKARDVCIKKTMEQIDNGIKGLGLVSNSQ